MKSKPEIILVGTAHVSKESVKEVKETIEKEKPKYVALELCEPRLEALTKKKKWGETPITELIKKNKVYFFLAYSLLSAFERKLSEKTGVRPGDEMLQGIKSAKKVGAKVILVDRPIAITLKRAWKIAGFKEKIRLFKEFFTSIFALEEVDEKTIEDLKRKDVLSELMAELSKMVPSAKRVLIDERDEYIAGKLSELDGKTVAVVGMGHKEGVEKILREGKKPDFKRLEEIPKSRWKWSWIFYLITALVIGLFIFAALNSPENFWEMLKYWFLINGVCSAVGAIIALAHPLSVLTAFVAAPFTSLSPAVGAGWVAGLVEAKMRMPRVKDFEALRDLAGIRGFWKNRVTRILLVAALANLGSMIGTFVALPYMAALI
ncbi:MAG: TraB/GumN family protein [Candidatus Altiarchaeota archaeon]|nr:TraB/GumN family protein [Candidatus Altiarchaeota archaeon]